MKRQKRQKVVRSKLHRSARTQHVQQEHQRSHVLMRVVFFLLTIFFIAVCVYTLLFSSLTKIIDVHVNGVQAIAQEDVRAHVQGHMEEIIFSSIPRDHYVVISSRAIEASLRERFRRIDTVRVNKHFPQRIAIDITERESVLVWCRDESQSHCFMMDRRGILYADADFSSDEIVQNNLVTIIDRSGREVALYDNILAEEVLNTILTHQAFFQNFSVFESEKTLMMHSRASGELIVRTKEGWEILLDVRRAPADTQRSVETFFKKITFAPEPKKEGRDDGSDKSEDKDGSKEVEEGEEDEEEKKDGGGSDVAVDAEDGVETTHNERPRSDLLYIDFRVDEKVFYKFKETDAEREAREKAEKGEDESEKEGKEGSKEDEEENKEGDEKEGAQAKDDNE